MTKQASADASRAVPLGEDRGAALPVYILICGVIALWLFSTPFVIAQTSRSNLKSNTSRSGATKKPPESKSSNPSSTASSPNLAKEPTLYVVGYAHLDTEWRWEYPQVIQEYLPKTMRNNFAFF